MIWHAHHHIQDSKYLLYSPKDSQAWGDGIAMRHGSALMDPVDLVQDLTCSSGAITRVISPFNFNNNALPLRCCNAMPAEPSPNSTSSLHIEELRRREFPAHRHTYNHRDVILYHLGLGCTLAQEAHLLYEGTQGGLAVLPTYAVVAAHAGIYNVPLAEYIPGFKPAQALHGEQYTELMCALPPSGTLITRPRLVDIQDKGKGAVVVARTETIDEATGKLVAINEFVSFVLGVGGFGTPWAAAPRPAAATASNQPPDRPPDITAEELVSLDQAALYRLSGDYNPLHIDPAVSASVGFPKPILHGLCTLGISVKLVLKALGPCGGDPHCVKSVKARFAKHVFPGERLTVQMWVSNPTKVIFVTQVQDRPGVVAISAAAVEFNVPLSAVHHDRVQVPAITKAKL